MHFLVSPKKEGCAGAPLRFVANVAPLITATSVSAQVGATVTFDVYAAADCGILLPKTLAWSSLPAGASWNAATGILTYAPTAAGTGSAQL